jgi:hypothetical protein
MYIWANACSRLAYRQVALMAGIHLEGEMLGPSDEDEDVFAPVVRIRFECTFSDT